MRARDDCESGPGPVRGKNIQKLKFPNLNNNLVFSIVLQMKHSGRLKLVYGMSRSITKTDFHPIIYFGINFLSLAQTLLTFLDPEYKLHSILKWVDICTYSDSWILMYLLAGLCIVCGCCIVVQQYWAACDQTTCTSASHHYFIKITVSMAAFVSYTLCLSHIRYSLKMIASPVSADQAVGVLGLIFFLGIVYPYSMFLLTDLSPQNINIYGMVSFPNCLTVLNLYRPIAALMACSTKHTYVLIPTGLLLLAEVLGILKCPILTWRYNKFSQTLISCLIWAILNRFLELILGSELPLLSCLLGAPIFAIFVQWITAKRLISIITHKPNTVTKLKVLYYLIINKKDRETELSIFLVAHYQSCQSQTCSCHLIVKALQKKAISSGSQATKHPGTKYQTASRVTNANPSLPQDLGVEQDGFQQQRTYWFGLLAGLQKEKLDPCFIDELDVEKERIRSKARKVILDLAEVLHYGLGKQYESLKCFWYHQSIEQNSVQGLFNLVRHQIQMSKLQQTIIKKSNEDGFNSYASNYYDVQVQLIHFKKLICRATKKTIKFWTELANEKPDQANLLTALSQAVKNRQEVEEDLRKIQRQYNSKMPEEAHRHEWGKRVTQLFEQNFINFQNALTPPSLASNEKQGENELKLGLTTLQHRNEKNLKFFDCRSKTAMAAVSIQEGPEFGVITSSNPSFWELVGRDKYEKAEINHFLIKQMHESHNRKMLNFLNQDKYFFNFHRVFILNASHLILQVQLSLQVIPHLSQGLFAAVFFQQVESEKAIILLDRFSDVLGYNSKFQQQFLQNSTAEEYETAMTNSIFSNLSNRQQASFNFKDDQISLKLCRTVLEEKTNQPLLHFCQISSSQHFPAELPKTKDGPPKSNRALQKIDAFSLNQAIRDKLKEQSLERERVQNKPQREKMNEVQDTEKAYEIFHALASAKTSRRLKKWQVLTAVILCSAVVLSILAAGLSRVKYNAYKSSSDAYGRLTEFTQQTAEILYLCRQVNILSHGKDGLGLESATSKLRSLKSAFAIGKVSINASDWRVTVPSYQVTPDRNVRVDMMTLDVVVHKNLLGCLTTYMEDEQNWGFDYSLDANCSACSLSLFSLIMNAYYTIMPNLHTEFRLFVEQKYKKPIVMPVPLIPVCMSMVVFILALGFLTLLTNLRILSSLDRSLQLLQKIRVSLPKERIELLQNYRQICLQTQWDEGAIRKQLEVTRQIIQTTELTEITARNFETAAENHNYEKAIGEEKVQVKLKPVDKTKSALLIFVVLSPIYLIGSSIVGYQAGQNSYMWGKLQLISLYNSKMENIRFINSYSHEFMYEATRFRHFNMSISTQLSQILESTYELSRKIEFAEAKESADYINNLNLFNSLSFCRILEQACQQGCRLCSRAQQQFYESKSKKQVQVIYIETARSLLAAYAGQEPSSQIRQQFMGDIRHEQLQSTCQHLISIGKYISSSYQGRFTRSLQLYSAGIFILSACVVSATILIFIFWTRPKKQEMELSASMAKTVVQLVSWKQFMVSRQLKKDFLDNISLFRFLL